MHITPSTGIEFGLAWLPALLLGIAMHEAGHVIGGRLAGIPILAWGIGVKDPWFRTRIGRTVFYIGWPLRGGLTIPATYTIERRPFREILLLAGGPAANLAGVMLGIALAATSIPAGIILSWVASSGFLFLISVIPCSPTMGGVKFKTDGLRILNALRFRKQSPHESLGPLVFSCRVIHDLLVDMGHKEGARHFSLLMAYVDICLGNTSNAEERLSNAQSEDLPFDVVFVSYCRMMVASMNGDKQADDVFELAKRLCKNDATALFVIEVNELPRRSGRGESIIDSLNKLKSHARNQKRGDWLSAVEIQEYFLRDDLGSADYIADDLLKRHARFVTEYEKASILALTTQRLFASGDDDKATQWFQTTKDYVRTTQCSISDRSTRQAFVNSAAKILANAPITSADWFEWDDASQKIERSDRREGPNTEAKPIKRSSFIILAFVFSILAIVFTSILASYCNAEFPSHSPTRIKRLFASVALYSILSFVFSFVGVYRKESIRGALIALLLSGTSLAFAAYFKYFTPI